MAVPTPNMRGSVGHDGRVRSVSTLSVQGSPVSEDPPEVMGSRAVEAPGSRLSPQVPVPRRSGSDNLRVRQGDSGGAWNSCGPVIPASLGAVDHFTGQGIPALHGLCPGRFETSESCNPETKSRLKTGPRVLGLRVRSTGGTVLQSTRHNPSAKPVGTVHGTHGSQTDLSRGCIWPLQVASFLVERIDPHVKREGGEEWLRRKTRPYKTWTMRSW